MRILYVAFLLMYGCLVSRAQIFSFDLDVSDRSKPAAPKGEELLLKMHAHYKGAPCKGYRFSQKNSHYRNDSLVGISVWHESILFPDKFRINFGDTSLHNFVVFRNDSAFNFRNGAFIRERRDSNNLLLLLGGMYYRSADEMLARLKAAGYNTALVSKQTWEGRKVYVIGAKEGDLSSNQVWIEPQTYLIVRILETMKNKDQMDMRFETHQKLCRAFVETTVSFRRNGRLEQVESYYDLQPVEQFEPGEFFPKR